MRNAETLKYEGYAMPTVCLSTPREAIVFCIECAELPIQMVRKKKKSSIWNLGRIVHYGGHLSPEPVRSQSIVTTTTTTTVSRAEGQHKGYGGGAHDDYEDDDENRSVVVLGDEEETGAGNIKRAVVNSRSTTKNSGDFAEMRGPGDDVVVDQISINSSVAGSEGVGVTIV